MLIGTIALSYSLFYIWFWCRISCWLRIIWKHRSENQQKWSYSLLKFFKILKNHYKKTHMLNTNIRPPCWKCFRCQSCFYATFVQCSPGFHMLTNKTHSYALFWLKSGRKETIKQKNRRKKKTVPSSFTQKKHIVLKITLKVSPSFYYKDILSKTNNSNDSVYQISANEKA